MADNGAVTAVSWTPRQISVLMVIVTACLCLVMLVCGILYLLASNTLEPEDIGEVTSVGVGSGLVGLAGVIAWVIKVALTPGAEP